MKDLRNLISSKEDYHLFADPEDTVDSVLQRMLTHGVDALVVVRNQKVLGIISEHDFLSRVLFQRKSPNLTKCNEVMTKNVCTVAADQNLEDCLTLMILRKIRHLPVLDHEKVVALLTIDDVVRALIDDREFLIEELVKYITGSNFTEKIWSTTCGLAYRH